MVRSYFMTKFFLCLLKALPITTIAFSSFVIKDDLSKVGLFDFGDSNVICYEKIENHDGMDASVKVTGFRNLSDTLYTRYENFINENMFSNEMNIGFITYKAEEFSLHVNYQLYDSSFMPCEPRIELRKGETSTWFNTVLEEDYYSRVSPYYEPEVAQYNFKENMIHIEFGNLGFENITYLILNIDVLWSIDHRLVPMGTNLSKNSKCTIAYKL